MHRGRRGAAPDRSRGAGAPVQHGAAPTTGAPRLGARGLGGCVCEADRLGGSPSAPRRLVRPDAGAAAGSASHTARPWLATASASATLRAEADARRLAAQRGGIQWLPAVGNACVLAAYLLMLTINGYVLGGSARGGLPVAPLLLLLHPYTPPTWALNPSNRYAPVVSAALSTLAGAALFEVGRRVLKGGLTLSVLRAVALTSCAAPSLVLFTAFLWTWRQQSSLVLWCRPPPNAAPVLSHAPPPPLTTPRTPSPSPRCLLPLNTVPLLLSHARPLYDLGAAGLLAAAAHLLLAGQLRAESQRYL